MLRKVAVHLIFATRTGHTIIDRALYLPESWAHDDERRAVAGIPDEVAFATRTRLTPAMLTCARAAKVRFSFFNGDEVYGIRELRRCVRSLGAGHAVAVKSDHRVTIGAGHLTAVDAVRGLPEGAWHRIRTVGGPKGVRDHHWCVINVEAVDIPEGHVDAGGSVLLARRHRFTGVVSYYRCFSPTPVTLARPVGS